MDYFSPGLREFSRVASRLCNRCRLHLAQKHLARVEAQLGLLGWEQADYEGEIQREVDKIKNVEREQARLSNAGAALGLEIAELNAQREESRKAFEEKRTALETRLAPVREDLTKMEGELRALHEQPPALERRLPQLERELREVKRQHVELLDAGAHTPELRDELTRLRQRTIAIPNEVPDVQAKLAQITGQIEALQKTRIQTQESEAALAREQRDLEAAFDKCDGELGVEIKSREREKIRVEKEADALEHEKKNPYQQIGRVLADNQIAPMNQPHALEAVYAARLRAQELEYEIAKLQADSEQEDRTMVQNSMILWGAIALAVTLILAALIRW